jgi:hypothetical protein
MHPNAKGVTMKRLVLRLGLAIGFLTTIAGAAKAQAACHGTPRGLTAAYEYGKLTSGNSQGIAVTLPGVRLAARVRDIDETLSGQEFDVRFSLPIGTSKFQVCPLLGIGYGRDEWDFSTSSSMTTQTLALRGGAAVGGEFSLTAGLSAIPFVQVAYQFRAVKFDVEDAGGDVEASADTVSGVEIEYGLVGRYRNFFAGVAANRSDDTEGIRPYQARWILGFSFGGGSRSSHAVIPAARSSLRKP